MHSSIWPCIRLNAIDVQAAAVRIDEAWPRSQGQPAPSYLAAASQASNAALTARTRPPAGRLPVGGSASP